MIGLAQKKIKGNKIVELLVRNESSEVLLDVYIQINIRIIYTSVLLDYLQYFEKCIPKHYVFF